MTTIKEMTAAAAKAAAAEPKTRTVTVEKKLPTLAECSFRIHFADAASSRKVPGNDKLTESMAGEPYIEVSGPDFHGGGYLRDFTDADFTGELARVLLALQGED